MGVIASIVSLITPDACAPTPVLVLKLLKTNTPTPKIITFGIRFVYIVWLDCISNPVGLPLSVVCAFLVASVLPRRVLTDIRVMQYIVTDIKGITFWVHQLVRLRVQIGKVRLRPFCITLSLHYI